MIKTEKQLSSLFINRIKQNHTSVLFNRPPILIEKEINSLYGRVDHICLLSTKLGRINYTNLKRIRNINDRASWEILLLLKKQKSKSVIEISKDLAVSPKTIGDKIKLLINNRIVYCTKYNRIKIMSGFIFPQYEIISVEAKLHNWKRALYQSIQSQIYSHRSYVLMPYDKIDIVVKNKELFKKLNIGLIAINTAGIIKIIVESKKTKPRSQVHHFLMVSRIIKNGFSKL